MKIKLSPKSRLWTILLFLAFLYGCSTLDKLLFNSNKPQVYYEEVPKPNPVIRTKYDSIDTLTLKHYTFCAETGKDGKAPSIISMLEDMRIRESIIKAFERTEIPIKISSNFSEMDYEKFCIAKNGIERNFIETFLNSHKSSGAFDENESNQIITLWHYGAYWDTEVEHEPPAGLVPTGRNRYRIIYTLYTLILNNESVAYQSHYFHRDTTFTQDPEVPEYKFPQEIWDSLAVLTMQKYKERLE